MLVDDVKVDDVKRTLDAAAGKTYLVKVGKRRFAKIVFACSEGQAPCACPSRFFRLPVTGNAPGSQHGRVARPTVARTCSSPFVPLMSAPGANDTVPMLSRSAASTGASTSS